jgi:hypothetical protein
VSVNKGPRYRITLRLPRELHEEVVKLSQVPMHHSLQMMRDARYRLTAGTNTALQSIADYHISFKEKLT